MSTPGPDDSPPQTSDELGGLDPKDLFNAALETAPSTTLSPQPADPDATVLVTPSSTSIKLEARQELPLPAELTALLPGGNYHVESFLGQGGMGAVYKGMQVRLKRPVAIKIMHRDFGKDHDFEARFEREAQAMAKLNHPNIVSVIDFGEAGPDYLYIVMELIDGADMMDVIRTGRMTQEMALTLLPQICDALQFAHDHGIVHRDIKPSNIMLTRDGRVKMCDFGLAKRYDVESSFRTQTGTGMGTPDYAAPEQFEAHSQIDHRADIYALGVMIYQMITGQLPRGVWKPPSQRADIDSHWDDIVGRAMQSDPADRYQKATEVKTDVSSISLTPVAQVSDLGGTKPSSAKSTTQPSATPPASVRRATTNSRAPLVFGLITGVIVIAVGAFFALKKPDQSGPLNRSEAEIASQGLPEGRAERGNPPSGTKAPEPAPGIASGTPREVRTTVVSIPGLPDLPPLTVPAGEPGLVKEFPLSGGLVRNLHLLPDSRRLLIVQDTMITLYDLETEKKVWFIKGGKGSVSSAVNADGSRFVDCCPFDTAGKSLIAPGPDGGYFEVKLYETATGNVLQMWKEPYTRMSKTTDQIALSPSGKTLVVRTGGYDPEGTTFVALEFGKEASIAKWTAAGLKGDVTHCLSETVFMSTGSGRTFEMNTAEPSARLNVPAWLAEVHFSSVLSPDKGWLAASNGRSCSVWDMQTGKSHLLENSTITMTFAAFAGNDLVVQRQEKGEIPSRHIQVWDRSTGLLLADYPPTKPGFYWGDRMTGAPDGQFFVNVLAPPPTAPNKDDRILQIWRLPKPGQVHGLVKAQPSQPAAAAASATKFPPGLWVKLFTKPEELHKSDSGVKWEDGWILFDKHSRHTIDLPLELKRNYAVRATAKRANEPRMEASIALRQQATRSDNYHFKYDEVPDAALRCMMAESGGLRELAKAHCDMAATGTEYAVMFGAVGGRLIARYGSGPSLTATDSKFSSGGAFVSGADDLRDIEVINLDGLPETEALRILGVDEKGNDLRGEAGVSATRDAPFVNSLDMKLNEAGKPSSQLPVSASSWTPLFPSADWQKSDGPGRVFEDGRVRLSNQAMMALMPTAGAGKIRAKVSLKPGIAVPAIVLRDGGDEWRLELVVNSVGTATELRLVRLGSGVGSLPRLIVTDRRESAFQGMKEYALLELTLTEGAISASAVGEGAAIAGIRGKDEGLSRVSEWGIRADNGWFESVEVQP